MIQWKEIKNKPKIDAQYLIICSSINWDSIWIDIARYDKGHWHYFGNSEFSTENLITHWSTINYP